MGQKRTLAAYPVSTEIAGRRYIGKFRVDGIFITVSALGRSKSQIGGVAVKEDLARRLLSEIVRERAPRQLQSLLPRVHVARAARSEVCRDFTVTTGMT